MQRKISPPLPPPCYRLFHRLPPGYATTPLIPPLRWKHRWPVESGQCFNTQKAREEYQSSATGPLISRREAGASVGMSDRQIKTAIRVASVPADVLDTVIEEDRMNSQAKQAIRVASVAPGGPSKVRTV